MELRSQNEKEKPSEFICKAEAVCHFLKYCNWAQVGPQGSGRAHISHPRLTTWAGRGGCHTQCCGKGKTPNVSLSSSSEKLTLVPKSFFKDFIYLFLERGEGREKDRERNINVWLPLAHPLPGTWPPTQACALTGNQTSNPLVCRPVLNPLNHTSQGSINIFDQVYPLLNLRQHMNKYNIKFLL